METHIWGQKDIESPPLWDEKIPPLLKKSLAFVLTAMGCDELCLPGPFYQRFQVSSEKHSEFF